MMNDWYWAKVGRVEHRNSPISWQADTVDVTWSVFELGCYKR